MVCRTQKIKKRGKHNEFKKLVKMLEAETDMEKAAEVLRKIDSLIIRKGVLRMGPFGYLHPLELESHICKRDAFKDYFDCDTWGYKWGYPVRKDCIYIQPGYAGIEIVLSMNEQYVVSCLIKNAYIGLFGNGINAPNADQKQIGDFFKRVGYPRTQCSYCCFFIE